MRPPSLHCNFFSSLKQVEKRLKLEENQPDSGQSSSTPSHVPDTNPTPTQSLSTPLYLHLTHPSDTNVSNTVEDSEPPQAFISSSSSSPQFIPTKETQPQINPPDSPTASNDRDEIQYLMQLLGLSDNLGETQKREKQKQKTVVCGGGSCGCECGFYEKIVGVKGPKCEKEVERMEGWIRHLLRNGSEPLRLAFLLIGKAAFESGDDSEFQCLEFPSVIDEFLKIDPPKYLRA
ncbi:hypothetical protein HRI_002266900 [Hibiscus trionum]|uniref:Uncharacterized protein n=1 Tax=Hibiscus trionum TaxID=183268 RepID=A0A9W7HZQ8_HIBTR|nr:hypothetical protein HRI_002266900 [Hibiscus trionum]